MRRRAMAAAAGLSGAVAAVCLATALAAGRSGPLAGFLAAAVAAAALIRGRSDDGREGTTLRLAPGGGVSLSQDRDGEPPFHPVGVTRNLILLARVHPGRGRLALWRDSVAPDGFRRIAAYALWRRSAMSDSAQRSELIAREAVRAAQSAPRTGRPRGQ
jgi:hypothetical protein